MSKHTNKRQSTRRLRRALKRTQEMVTGMPMRSSRFLYGSGAPMQVFARIQEDVDLPDDLSDDGNRYVAPDYEPDHNELDYSGESYYDYDDYDQHYQTYYGSDEDY